MGHFREAHKNKPRQPKRELEHIQIWGNGQGDSHVIQHHFDDGSVEHYEFPHDRDGNQDALVHLSEHMGMRNPDEQEEELVES